jgi:hypothetical protein
MRVSFEINLNNQTRQRVILAYSYIFKYLNITRQKRITKIAFTVIINIKI